MIKLLASSPGRSTLLPQHGSAERTVSKARSILRKRTSDLRHIALIAPHILPNRIALAIFNTGRQSSDESQTTEAASFRPPTALLRSISCVAASKSSKIRRRVRAAAKSLIVVTVAAIAAPASAAPVDFRFEGLGIVTVGGETYSGAWSIIAEGNTDNISPADGDFEFPSVAVSARLLAGGGALDALFTEPVWVLGVDDFAAFISDPSAGLGETIVAATGGTSNALADYDIAQSIEPLSESLFFVDDADGFSTNFGVFRPDANLGDTITYTANVASVPLPAGLPMLAAGLLALFTLRIRNEDR